MHSTISVQKFQLLSILVSTCCCQFPLVWPFFQMYSGHGCSEKESCLFQIADCKHSYQLSGRPDFTQTHCPLHPTVLSLSAGGEVWLMARPPDVPSFCGLCGRRELVLFSWFLHALPGAPGGGLQNSSSPSFPTCSPSGLHTNHLCGALL